eukprot:212135-Rhodomonas_salina.1
MIGILSLESNLKSHSGLPRASADRNTKRGWLCVRSRDNDPPWIALPASAWCEAPSKLQMPA